MNHKLMILGAGRGQLGLIKAARNLGVTTVVASLPSDTAPGLAHADETVWADITDPDAILRGARDSGITAIATSCADSGVPALGAVCDALGLPGLSRRSADICADKTLMKEAFNAYGVLTAQHRIVSSHDQLGDALDQLRLPVIIKAPDLQGSKGIVVVRDRARAGAALEEVLAQTSRDDVVVEEFIEGLEFGAQAMVIDGEVVFVLLHDDDVFQAATAVPVEHAVPSTLTPHAQEIAKEQVRRAIAATGLDNCAVNVDLILRGDEVFMIELTGRVGANGLPEMLSAHFGADYYAAVARLALGQPVGIDFDHVEAEHVIVRMLGEPDLKGTIEAVTVNAEAAPDADIWMFRSPGDTLNGFTHSGDCVGQVTVTGDSAQEARARLAQAMTAYDITMRS